MSFPQKFRLRRSTLVQGLGLLVLGAAAFHYLAPGDTEPPHSQTEAGPKKGRGPGGGHFGGDGAPQAVRATEARRGDLDIVLSALGTVTASNTATVRPRVSGQLVAVRFQEGQALQAGDLLAEIDPRPFRIQLDQAHAQRLKNEAVLGAARLDLERYRALLAQDSIARQQVETQEALVRQHAATVEADKAQEASARLQLEFTRVTAPAAGRVGLRQVDVGNLVNAQDSGGIAVITQTQPIHAVFSLPADSLAPVLERLQGRDALVVEAWSRDGKTRLAQGYLLSVDNQIDLATGTLKLKAEFRNQDNSLLPNQFVNVRLRVESRKDGILLQSAAIQRQAQGSFVYLVQADQTVTSRPVRTGPANGDLVIIEEGLAAGDQVVLDGTDRLRPGAQVDVLSVDGTPRLSAAEATAGPEGGKPGGEGKPRRHPDGAGPGAKKAERSTARTPA